MVAVRFGGAVGWASGGAMAGMVLGTTYYNALEHSAGPPVQPLPAHLVGISLPLGGTWPGDCRISHSLISVSPPIVGL